MIVGRGSAARNRNRNRNKNRYLSGMSYTGGCLNLFLLWLFFISTSDSSTYYRCFVYIWLRGILNFVTCDLVPRSKVHIHYSSIPASKFTIYSPKNYDINPKIGAYRPNARSTSVIETISTM